MSLVMILATASLGWIGLRNRGELGRIGESRTAEVSLASPQDVVARMWEDPLQAVSTAAPSHDKAHSGRSAHHHSPQHVAEDVKQNLFKHGGVSLIVIPIPDTPYPEDVESRLRTRYAMQMAFANELYTPDNRERLGYFRFPSEYYGSTTASRLPAQVVPSTTTIPHERAAHSSTGALTLYFHMRLSALLDVFTRIAALFSSLASEEAPTGALVPYEWFLPPPLKSTSCINAGESPAILVIWLPNSILENKPLRSLAKLQSALTGSNSVELMGLSLIGPPTSDGLKALIADDTCVTALHNVLSIYSSQATASDAQMGFNPLSEATIDRTEIQARIRDKLASTESSPLLKPSQRVSRWPFFRNLIAPDNLLTDLLVTELNERGVDTTGDGSDIMLLAEADTKYGRSLPVTFQASCRNQRSCEKQSHVSARTATHITIHKYLCGLDMQKGQHSESKTAQRRSVTSPEQALTDALSKDRAMPLGESQLDYVDRLIESIERGGKEHRPRNKIRAVGVLGSNFYDKMILLRALRPRFPGAVFFTTDLDARMWHPNHAPFTTNLVVASAYDVNSHVDPSAEDLPPFRDVYQVSAYKAIQAAIQDHSALKDGSKSAAPTPSASIFEIGRNRQVKLTPSVGGDLHTQLSSVPEGRTWLWHFFRSKSPHFGGFLLILVTTSLGIATWNYFNVEPGGRKIKIRQGELNAMISLGFVSLFCVLTFMLSEGDSAEPWFLNEGVSAWPTEIIRMTIITCIFCSFASSFRDFRSMIKSLNERFFVLGSYGLVRAVAIPSHPEAIPEGQPTNLPSPNETVTKRYATQLTACSKWVHSAVTKENVGKMSAQLRQLCEELIQRLATALLTKAESQSTSRSQADPVAANLCEAYLVKSCNGWLFRVVLGAGLYLSFAIGLTFLMDGEIAPKPHIRGLIARWIDSFLLWSSIAMFFVLVFYVLDRVMAAAQLLRSVDDKEYTIWPEAAVKSIRERFNVSSRVISRYLDFGLAVCLSTHTSKMIYMPFCIIFGFVVSRSAMFDRWEWPVSLVVMFVCNAAMSCASWIILRQSADKIRKNALQSIAQAIEEKQRKWCDAKWKHPQGVLLESTESSELFALKKMKTEIESERSGAYTDFFQDPAVFAAMLPTSVLGIVTIIAYMIFGGV
ncbi:hypothetical protein [Schlesneria paludicola]|uniref:hypothetical protein n=1 Tax=Schlesneria paludicola TaxID=360056 RepID=UPI0012F7F912|nr:hypothetical protein [Schlesneria paludicola]